MGESDASLKGLTLNGDIVPGRTIVKVDPVITAPDELGGIFVRDDYKQRRRAGIEGIYWGWVPGHGGDVWWVCHQTDEEGNGVPESAAVYSFTEVTIMRHAVEPLKNMNFYED